MFKANTDYNIYEIARAIKESKSTVFFGGAGVSTESGIPDFRSARGIYNENYHGLSAEDIVSAGFFAKHTDKFYRFYREKMVFADAQPNKAHIVLAELEAMGLLDCVITQNIDGLHQKAGSKNVTELHGTIHKNTCLDCGRKFDLSIITDTDGVPHCPYCHGIIKPDVVLYGEALPADAVDSALEAIYNADVLIIGGTSLSVYPAASYIHEFHGEKLILINYSKTAADSLADIVAHDSVGKVLSDAVEIIKNGEV